MNYIMLTLLTCKDASQNLHDDLSNVSHLPTVNQRIER